VIPLAFTEIAETASSTDGASTATSGATTATPWRPVFAVVIATATVAAAPTFSGQGFTWTRRLNELWGASDANSMYLFDAPPIAAPSAGEFTFDCTGDNHTGCIIHVVQVAGADPGNTFVQRVSTSNPTPGTGTTVQITMSATRAESGVYMAIANLNNPATMGFTGWTENMDTGYGTPTTGMAAWSNPSPGSVTTIGPDSGGTKLQWGAIAIEVRRGPKLLAAQGVG
jgi:hypothetical protein